MGGYGSGRWDGYTKATTVEEALGLPTTHVRAGLNYVADHGGAWQGLLQWSRSGRVTSTISYWIEEGAGQPLVRLMYTTTRPRGEQIKSDYPVAVVATVPHFGGRRWWWICPLLRRGRPCVRRVGKLYCPPGAINFGCRHCYALTYERCQESHKYDGLAKLLGVDRATFRLLERRLREYD